MNVVDVIIIALLILGGVAGFIAGVVAGVILMLTNQKVVNNSHL